ncbi:type IIA topoisomerase [Psychrobacter sp. JCM 18901]|nr:type IIA topoisomerase [Psychrobacter sp. JCM 18901]
MVFSDIYKETMRFVKASDYYFFDDDYFFNLLENLQEKILLITAYQDDKAIGSSIYTLCQESGIMQFHLGGTLNAYTHLQPSNLSLMSLAIGDERTVMKCYILVAALAPI